MNNDNGSVSYAVTLDHKQMNRDKQDVVNIFHEIGQEAQQHGNGQQQRNESANHPSIHGKHPPFGFGAFAFVCIYGILAFSA